MVFEWGTGSIRGSIRLWLRFALGLWVAFTVAVRSKCTVMGGGGGDGGGGRVLKYDDIN